MRWFTKRAPQPPKDWAGPEAYFDWTEKDLDLVSEAIRRCGQPESPGFRTFALIALNTLRGGSAVELVARAMEKSSNPSFDPDRPISGGHYMAGMPHWTMWVDYAQGAVRAITGKPVALTEFEQLSSDQLAEGFKIEKMKVYEGESTMGFLFRRRKK